MPNPNSPGGPGGPIRPITPAPPLRSRPPRPEKRPEIKLSAPKEESRFIPPVPLAIGVIALAATLGLAHKITTKTEDPNYVHATGSLNQYELGRPESERNYDSPVYVEVLDALAKVDPESISAEKATLLADDIRSRTDLFHRRIRARTEAETARQASKFEIDEDFQAAYQRDLLAKKKDYPECKEGEAKHEH